jgi:hypothetical protein
VEEGDEDENDGEEKEHTSSPDRTDTCTESDDHCNERRWVTVSFTTYTDPALRRYDGSLNCRGFTDTDLTPTESSNTPSSYTPHT